MKTALSLALLTAVFGSCLASVAYAAQRRHLVGKIFLASVICTGFWLVLTPCFGSRVSLVQPLSPDIGVAFHNMLSDLARIIAFCGSAFIILFSMRLVLDDFQEKSSDERRVARFFLGGGIVTCACFLGTVLLEPIPLPAKSIGPPKALLRPVPASGAGSFAIPKTLRRPD